MRHISLTLALLLLNCDQVEQTKNENSISIVSDLEDAASSLLGCVNVADGQSAACIEDVLAQVGNIESDEYTLVDDPRPLTAPEPEAEKSQSWDGFAYQWWSSRPNAILLNHTGNTLAGFCRGSTYIQPAYPGGGILCNSYGVGLIGWPPPGVVVYYCTAQLDCIQAN